MPSKLTTSCAAEVTTLSSRATAQGPRSPGPKFLCSPSFIRELEGTGVAERLHYYEINGGEVIGTDSY